MVTRGRVGRGRSDRGRVREVGQAARVYLDDHVQYGRAGGQVAKVAGYRAGDVRAAVVGRDEAGAGRDRVGHLHRAGKRGPAVGDRDRVAQVVARGDRKRTVRVGDREIGRRVDAGRLGRRVVTRGRVGSGRG